MKNRLLLIIIVELLFSGMVQALNCPSTNSDKSSAGSLDTTPDQTDTESWFSIFWGPVRKEATASFSYRWDATRFGNNPVPCGSGMDGPVTISMSSVESSTESVNWGIKAEKWGVSVGVEVGSSCSSVSTIAVDVESSYARSLIYKYELNYYQQLCDIEITWSDYYKDVMGKWHYISSGDDSKTGVKTTIHKEEIVTTCCKTS